MIDTNKLIPRRKEGGRSIKTIGNIELIKKDVVKIDSLLKEKLVLSKVRYRILRNQNERDRRIKREGALERKKSRPQDYDANLKSNKKGRGLGGFLGGILKALLVGIGFTIFKSLPALLRIGKVIKNLIVPFTIGASVLIGAIASIASVGAKILPNVKGKNFEGASAKSINQGIENFKSALINTALAFAGGALGGAIVSRLLRGRTFTEREAIQELGRVRTSSERAKMKQADDFTKYVAKGAGVSFADAKEMIKSGELVEMIDDVEALKKGKTIKKKFGTIKTFDELADYLDAEDAYERLIMERVEREAGSDLAAKRTVEQQSGTTIKDFKPLTKEEFKKEGRRKIKAKAGEIEAEQKLFDKFLQRETIKKQKKLADLAQVRIDRTAGRRKGVAIDFSDFAEVDIDIEELIRFDREMRGKKPKRVSKEAIVGDQPFMRAPIIPKKPKINASKLAGKKGISKLLFKVGGEAFEQTVKQTIKASVGVVPIIGDLLGFILDVFLFGQPVGRAAFMALGSFIGSLIGGVFGLIGGPPGVLVGGILGGIGGDLLGGAFYDLIFRDNVAGRITENLSQSFVKKGVKTGVGAGLLGGGFAPYGGRVHAGEFVFNEKTTDDLEKKYPGLLTALNNSRGSQVDQVLETYMSYGNESEGSERLIPLPFEKVVTRTVLVENDGEDTSSSPFMDLYRRG